jgi:hypothetical protein
MNKITNIEELHSEILRLRKTEQEQREKIKGHLTEIREELKPANMFMSFISSVFGIHIDKNEFLKDGIAYGISVILQRFILKTEKKFEKKIYDWVDNVFDRIKHFMNRFTEPSARREERKVEEEPFIPGE